MRVRKAVVAAGLAVTMAVLGACGGDDSDEGDAAEGPVATEVHKIGEVVKLGNVDVVVHGIKDPFDYGNAAVKAAPGTRQVAVEVEVKNNSDTRQVFSPFSQFELKDSTNKSFIAIAMPRNIPLYGGEAPPGTAKRGLVVYQIPEASTGLQITFQNPTVTEGSVTYNLS